MLIPSRPSKSTLRSALPRRRVVRALLPAVILFGASLPLPSIRIGLTPPVQFEPGYQAALFVELAAWDVGIKLARSAAGPVASTDGFNLSGNWPILAGATANHLLALSCLGAICRRLRLATWLAILSAGFAIGSLLPAQLLNLDRSWDLGPGYFLWCAAPLALAWSLCLLQREQRREMSLAA